MQRPTGTRRAPVVWCSLTLVCAVWMSANGLGTSSGTCITLDIMISSPRRVRARASKSHIHTVNTTKNRCENKPVGPVIARNRSKWVRDRPLVCLWCVWSHFHHASKYLWPVHLHHYFHYAPRPAPSPLIFTVNTRYATAAVIFPSAERPAMHYNDEFKPDTLQNAAS